MKCWSNLRSRQSQLGSSLPDHYMWTWFTYCYQHSQSKNWHFQHGICHVSCYEGQNGLWSHQEHHYNLVQNVFSEVIDWWNANDIYWIYLMLLNFSLKQKSWLFLILSTSTTTTQRKWKRKWKEKRLEEILRESESYKYSNKPMIWKFQTCFIFLIRIRFTWSLCVNMIYILLPTFSKQKIGIFKT